MLDCCCCFFKCLFSFLSKTDDDDKVLKLNAFPLKNIEEEKNKICLSNWNSNNHNELNKIQNYSWNENLTYPSLEPSQSSHPSIYLSIYFLGWKLIWVFFEKRQNKNLKRFSKVSLWTCHNLFDIYVCTYKLEKYGEIQSPTPATFKILLFCFPWNLPKCSSK